jgi:nucleoside-diphosphate-sugar epimerase
VATALLAKETPVRMVNRTGTPTLDRVETIGGDATDSEFAEAASKGATTIYFCLNAPNYRRWPEEFPPLQRAVLAAPRRTGAKLVVLENLYLYGPNDGPLRESTAVRPTSAKSATRAQMSAELLDAHHRGHVRVAIGRASDFVGPGVVDSALGATVFGRAVAGKRVQVVGRPDTHHTYSYVPDVGRNLVTLGSRDDADGRAWHLPNPVTRTTRQILADVYAAAGSHRRDATVLGAAAVRAIGLVSPNVRELLHTLYQFDRPFLVDDTAFRDTFGGHTTDWTRITGDTVAWYRCRADRIQPTAPSTSTTKELVTP